MYCRHLLVRALAACFVLAFAVHGDRAGQTHAGLTLTLLAPVQLTQTEFQAHFARHRASWLSLDAHHDVLPTARGLLLRDKAGLEGRKRTFCVPGAGQAASHTIRFRLSCDTAAGSGGDAGPLNTDTALLETEYFTNDDMFWHRQGGFYGQNSPYQPPPSQPFGPPIPQPYPQALQPPPPYMGQLNPGPYPAAGALPPPPQPMLGALSPWSMNYWGAMDNGYYGCPSLQTPMSLGKGGGVCSTNPWFWGMQRVLPTAPPTAAQAAPPF